jgi:signal transduction histidine kinase
VICSLEDDRQGHFWLSSHGGIVRVSIEDLNQCADRRTAYVNCLVYGKSEGLPTAECSGGFEPIVGRTADGRLWFPTRKGLVGVAAGTVHTNLTEPPVILEEILVDGTPVGLPPGTKSFTVRPGQERLEFHYTGLCFRAPERVRFKYRLDDLESEWVDAGARRSASYSYLPPGNYTFHVTACNNDGIWNQSGASIDFAVLPRFWQTWWFRILGGVSTVASAGGLALFEARRRMRRKLELIERQQAIERERARIARDIHDDLGASLTHITMLSQSASNKPERDEELTADMTQIYQTARDLTRSMDEIVWAVNPQHDSLDSLAAYLGKYSQDFLRPLNIACRLDMPLQLPHLPLTAEVRHNFFLAFKEALNNVAKHSGATEVRISLTPGSEQFELAVHDNGRGFVFPPAQSVGEPGINHAPTGNGISNMFNRMAKIAGKCQIISKPGEGTIAKFTAFSNPTPERLAKLN